MNPFDEIAVEEAVRLMEQGIASEVIAVSIGPESAADTLRTALAMGASRAILIRCDTALEPLGVAKILKAVCQREMPDLMIAGKQAIDGDHAQTGPMLAGLMGWAQATCAYRLEISEGVARVTCETDHGLETLALRLPAVVTTDLRLNEPRYASLPNVMKARKKPLETIAADELATAIAPRLEILSLAEPKPRPAGIMVSSVAELLDKLEAEGVLR